MPRRHLFFDRNERVIAVVRIVLGASGLFAVWMDPAEPVRFVAATYGLHFVYVAYSMALVPLMWSRSSTGPLALLTHGVDILFFSVFQYMTLGPSSPFFTYFIFSLFCGELRWGWRGTCGTAILVVVLYLTMGAWMSRTLGPTEFELNRLIIRTVYLCVAATLLVYLGQHEIRLRGEIERLARWPAAAGLERDAALHQVLGHAAEIVGAGRIVVAWQAGDELGRHVATWSQGNLTVTAHDADDFDPIASLDSGAGDDVMSARFYTERVRGRVFFSDLGPSTSELAALTEIVARDVGGSIDHLQLTQQLRELGASEQRVRVARDLHDGVLQSLTGIRFELQTVATRLTGNEPERDRLLALERALAIEQRELRLFIRDLKPSSVTMGSRGALAGRLEALRERIALEWKVPVTIRVVPHTLRLPEEFEQAVPLMVHEAIVNALKHAAPSRISVDIAVDADAVRITVGDDGRGFPFSGRWEHARLAAENAGPASLRERAASLGGEMTIESSLTGSRVEIALPLGARRA